MSRALTVPSARLICRIYARINQEGEMPTSLPFPSQPLQLFDKCRLYSPCPGCPGHLADTGFTSLVHIVHVHITSLLCLSWPAVPAWTLGHPHGQPQWVQLVPPQVPKPWCQPWDITAWAGGTAGSCPKYEGPSTWRANAMFNVRQSAGCICHFPSWLPLGSWWSQPKRSPSSLTALAVQPC